MLLLGDVSDFEFDLYLSSNQAIDAAPLGEFISALADEASRFEEFPPGAILTLVSASTNSPTTIRFEVVQKDSKLAKTAQCAGIGAFIAAMAVLMQSEGDSRLGDTSAKLMEGNAVACMDFHYRDEEGKPQICRVDRENVPAVHRLREGDENKESYAIPGVIRKRPSEEAQSDDPDKMVTGRESMWLGKLTRDAETGRFAIIDARTGQRRELVLEQDAIDQSLLDKMVIVSGEEVSGSGAGPSGAIAFTSLAPTGSAGRAPSWASPARVFYVGPPGPRQYPRQPMTEPVSLNLAVELALRRKDWGAIDHLAISLENHTGVMRGKRILELAAMSGRPPLTQAEQRTLAEE